MKHARPGFSDPCGSDYWWNQEHDRRFYTFIDKYPVGSEPEVKAKDNKMPRVSRKTP